MISNDIIIIIVTLFYCNCINNLYLYLETINIIFKKKKNVVCHTCPYLFTGWLTVRI